MLKRHSKFVIFIALLLAVSLPILAGGRAYLIIAQAQLTTTARSSSFYEEHERHEEKDEIHEGVRQPRPRRLHLTFDRLRRSVEQRLIAADARPPLSWWRVQPLPLRPVDYLLAPLPLRAPPACA